MAVSDLIRTALITGGIVSLNETIYAEDMYLAFDNLNAMVSTWNRERWLVYNLIDTAVTSTGAQSYTIGVGGTFNVPRPDRLETAYARLLTGSPSNPFDFPLTLIYSREDYAALTLKSLTTFPTSVFLNSDWPLGSVYVWPIPAAGQFELHMVLKNTLPAYVNLSDVISLPPEYENAMIYNLAARLRPLYKLPPEPTVLGLAKASLGIIRSSNAQVPELRMPSSVLNNRSGYDVTLGNLNGLPFAGA